MWQEKEKCILTQHQKVKKHKGRITKKEELAKSLKLAEQLLKDQGIELGGNSSHKSFKSENSSPSEKRSVSSPEAKKPSENYPSKEEKMSPMKTKITESLVETTAKPLDPSERSDSPFTCLTCKKIFKDKNELSVHEKIHTGERRFACNICPRKFAQVSSELCVSNLLAMPNVPKLISTFLKKN